MVGGVQAVTWTDVKQMVVIVAGVLAAVVVLIFGLPDDVGVGAGAARRRRGRRMNAIDFRFDLHQTYTFWSGLIGGLFLMLSYFGCDQSQVQRYLTAKSVDEGRHSLLMSAFVKIPLQALVLLTGVLCSCSSCSTSRRCCSTGARGEDAERARGGRVSRRSRRSSCRRSRRDATPRRAGGASRDDAGRDAASLEPTRALQRFRGRCGDAGARRRGDGGYEGGHRRHADAGRQLRVSDVHHDELPIGFVGLMIAAIFAAAMSSIARS